MMRSLVFVLVLLTSCSGDNNTNNGGSSDTGTSADSGNASDTRSVDDDSGANPNNQPLTAGDFSVVVDGTLVEFSEEVSVGRYDANGWFEITGKVAGAAGRHEIFINFEDNGVATLDCGDPRRVHIIYYYPESGFPVVGQNITAGSSCEVDISALGEVGELVTGTFSGTMANNNGTVEFTNGQFDLPRGEDL